MDNKYVYLAWREEQSLGEIINGTISTYHLCKKNKYNLLIDVSNNLVSNFSKIGKTTVCLFSQLNCSLKEYDFENVPFFDSFDKMEDYTKSFFINNETLDNCLTEVDDSSMNLINPKNNICYLSSSVIPITTFTDDDRKLIKDLLHPNDLIHKLVEYQSSILPIDYNSIYYNIGDEQGVPENANHYKFPYYLGTLNRFYEKTKINNLVFFSDSYELKKYIRSENKIPMPFINNPLNNEICDFYMISKSKNIYFFYEEDKIDINNNYKSHFAFLSSIIHNVPIFLEN